MIYEYYMIWQSAIMVFHDFPVWHMAELDELANPGSDVCGQDVWE